MELLLNVIWLLLAAAAVIIWLCQKRGGASAGRGRRLLQSVALGCALAVLFPAISATDDLHAAQLAVDASDAARKMLRNMNTMSSSGAVDWLHFLPALLLLVLAVTPWRKFIGKVLQSCALSPQAIFSSILVSRAPPAGLCA